jgi:hypothetical protein
MSTTTISPLRQRMIEDMTVKSLPTPTPFRLQGRPLFGARMFRADGAETGGAEPHIAEQSRSWRAASGEREFTRDS